ncbi:MAG: Ig-like domain-containing protein, partial [Deltaproteobacteria bacterium]|nr:Ig-like domain-containing protein [Deltaproteobacteria bacterium]
KDFIWLFTTGTGTDGTAPTATINPANGATGVPVNSAVVITFNEFFDISAGGTVSVTPGPVAGGSVMNFMAKTVAFTPTTSLAANTTYTVNISGFKDMAGNGMAPIAPTFTTQ